MCGVGSVVNLETIPSIAKRMVTILELISFLWKCQKSEKFKKKDYLPINLSEHAAIWLKIERPSNPTPRSWTLNRRLLLQSDIMSKIERDTADFFKWNSASAPAHVVWDTFKAWLRGSLKGALAAWVRA